MAKKKVVVEEIDVDFNIDDILMDDIKEFTDSKLPDLVKSHETTNRIENLFLDPIVDYIDVEDGVFTDEVPEDDVGEPREVSPPLSVTQPNALTEAYSVVSNLNDDFEIVRKNLIQLTSTGALMLDDLLAVAKASEHPSAYKTVTETLVSLSQLNKDLIDLYDKKLTIETKIKKNISEQEKNLGDNIQNNTQNNFFVGTTDDLFKKLAESRLIGKQDG